MVAGNSRIIIDQITLEEDVDNDTRPSVETTYVVDIDIDSVACNESREYSVETDEVVSVASPPYTNTEEHIIQVGTEAQHRIAEDYQHEATEPPPIEQEEAHVTATSPERRRQIRRINNSLHSVHGILSLFVVAFVFLSMVVLYPICNEEEQHNVGCTRAILLSIFSVLLAFFASLVILHRYKNSDT